MEKEHTVQHHDLIPIERFDEILRRYNKNGYTLTHRILRGGYWDCIFEPVHPGSISPRPPGEGAAEDGGG